MCGLILAVCGVQGPSAANSAIDKAKTELEKGMRDDVFLKLEKVRVAPVMA